MAKLLNWPFMLLLEQAQGTKREITNFLRFLLYLKKPSDLKDLVSSLSFQAFYLFIFNQFRLFFFHCITMTNKKQLE